MADKLVMKSNLSALKEAWMNKKNGGGGSFKYWKPREDGRYIIRFLPPKTSNGLFYKEVAQHKIGDNYFFCPKIEGDNCPICTYYKGLYDKGDDASIALAKEIKPKKQFLYNIVVRKENEKDSEDPNKVQIYMSGKLVYDSLMDYFFDDDYGDLTDVEKGYDFVLKKEPGDLGFPNYKNSKPRKDPSKLHEDEDVAEKILSQTHDLDKEVEYKTATELKSALDDFLGNKGEVSPKGASNKKTDDDDDVPAPRKTPVAKPDDTVDDFEADLLKQLGS